MARMPIQEELSETRKLIEIKQLTIERQIKDVHRSMDELEQLRRDLELIESYAKFSRGGKK